MITHDKQLPTGCWYFIPRLSPETTDVVLRDFLAGRGLDLPIENVSVRKRGHFSTAMISVPELEVEDILEWLFAEWMTGQLLHGHEIHLRKSRKKLS